MVGTIIPIVNGARTQGRISIAHWLHLVGAVAGGAGIGAALGAAGSAARAATAPAGALVLVPAGTIAAIYSARELGIVSVPMPQFHRQVPAWWRYRYQPNIAAFLYGIGLGVGVATFVRVATLYVVLAWVAFAGDPASGALAMGLFGAARALPVVWLGNTLATADEGFAVMTFLNRWELVVHLVNGVLLAWAAATIWLVATRAGL